MFLQVFCAVLQQQGGTVATLRPELLVVLANEPQHELRVAVSQTDTHSSLSIITITILRTKS